LARSTLRASSYTIYAELPGDREHVLLAHGYNGAFDRVSREVARYLRSVDKHPPKPLYGEWSDWAVTEAVPVPPGATVELLRERGYLTTMTRSEERLVFERFVAAKQKHAATRRPDYIVMPTYDCNLRCAYCFQDHMRTDASYGHLLRLITRGMVDRIIAAVPHIEQRAGVDPCSKQSRTVVLFGGEPLLARSRPTIEYIMSSFRALGDTHFVAVSNATELEAYEDLLGPDGISLIQITVDGVQASHDVRRVYADGSGSFDRIMRNVDAALDRGTLIDLRTNVDRTNVDSLPELAAAFESRGWFDRAEFSAYLRPVHGTGPGTDRKKMFNSHELRRAVVAMREQHPQVGRFALPDDELREGLRAVLRDGVDPFRQMKSSYCGAHSSMYVFDAFGDIYACWERTGDKSVRIGWIEADGKPEFVADRLLNWRSRTVASNDTCAQCRYSMYCGGGCAVLAEGIHGTTYGNYCDAFGRRFRDTLAEAYELRGVADVADARAVELRTL
jgi:uncharacterized protein